MVPDYSFDRSKQQRRENPRKGSKGLERAQKGTKADSWLKYLVLHQFVALRPICGASRIWSGLLAEKRGGVGREKRRAYI